MPEYRKTFRAIVSSDWSECLSPNGPFDPMWFNYPHLRDALTGVFREYTGNLITLRTAVSKIKELLPQSLTPEQMYDYLNASFRTYKGVPQLMQWCMDHDILFMLNTTGTQGYFQAALAKNLIPGIPAIAANPMISYPQLSSAGIFDYEINEIEDKPKNTEKVMNLFNIPPEKIIVMGDSGGDGPHFQWAQLIGAHRIGSMTKQSLTKFCESRSIKINTYFGINYQPGSPRDLEAEMNINFMDLTGIFAEIFELSQ
jgi:hypothetical protein